MPTPAAPDPPEPKKPAATKKPAPAAPATLEAPTSPVPWIFVAGEDLEGDQGIEPGQCAVFTEDRKGEPKDLVAVFRAEADARRAIVCVNACNGILSVHIDAGALTTLTELLNHYVNVDACKCPKPPAAPDAPTRRCIRCLSAKLLVDLGGETQPAPTAPAGGNGSPRKET